ncbi:diphthamide synthesis protein [Candidatus Woesearchaeota archaeon]|nr:diphthamide synthesis protein [Candidatus Woesearchaeota archaeon]
MYDIKLEPVIKDLKDMKAKTVLIQLPDGIKPQGAEIADKIEAETGAKVTIWAGTAYGACDIPIEVDNLGFDALVHFGHSQWKF